MNIFGKELSKIELLSKIGDITQLGGIKLYEFIDGVSKGIRAVDIKSACGIDMTILLDRGMDISHLSYKSIPISWMSSIRETSPIYYESKGDEWLRTFYGGLLTTCGLTYMGNPCMDEGEELGLHGRISNISAENVCTNGNWEKDNYVMWIKGKVREAKVFGNKLELTRKITTWMDKPQILLEDTVENIGLIESPHMIIYHINIGYPIVDSKSKIVLKETKIIPRDEISKEGLDKCLEFSEPRIGFNQQVFFHEIKPDNEGNSNISIVNPVFNNGQGIEISLKYNKNNLPYLIQWKEMGGKGEYVCGIEPANGLPYGRNIEREKQTLKFLKPGEKVSYRLEFNIDMNPII